MTRVKRHTGWLAIIFVILLFLSAGMVTLPSSAQSAAVITTFYAENRTIILITQVIGLIAAPVFIFFAFGLQNSLSSTPASERLDAIGITGIIVAIASIGTAVPVIALSLTTALLPFWVRMTDLSDAVLFLAIAAFGAAGALRGTGAPAWWRTAAALTGLLALARSIAGFSGINSVLDMIAPLAFIAFMIGTGIYLLLSKK